MYPFERFTARAKKVLALAQQEAESSHHSYIGTEHLLLGLLREQEGLAAKALANLGVEIDVVRQTIDELLGRSEGIIVQQIIPTSRVKQVIELAFEEAERSNQTEVGTEHLLLGLLIEAEGIAAHVLERLGADLVRVRRELVRLGGDAALLEAGGVRPEGLPSARRGAAPLVQSRFVNRGALSWGSRSALALAEEEAGRAGAVAVGPEHLLSGLLRQGEGLAARALSAKGVRPGPLRAQRGAAAAAEPGPIQPSDELLSALSVPRTSAREHRGTGALLRALLADPEGGAARALRGLGVEPDAVLAELERLEGEPGAEID